MIRNIWILAERLFKGLTSYLQRQDNWRNLDGSQSYRMGSINFTING
jgi:hypothetical protein